MKTIAMLFVTSLLVSNLSNAFENPDGKIGLITIDYSNTTYVKDLMWSDRQYYGKFYHDSQKLKVTLPLLNFISVYGQMPINRIRVIENLILYPAAPYSADVFGVNYIKEGRTYGVRVHVPLYLLWER